MTTDKMREDFEAEMIKVGMATYLHYETYKKQYSNLPMQRLWRTWQAATEQSTAKIAQMQDRIDELVEVLNYVGYAISGKGAPPNQAFSYTEITKCQIKISEALEKVKDKV